MATSMPFALGTMTQGLPQTPSAQAMISAACAGGGGTAALFNQMNSLQSLYQFVVDQPASAWTNDTDAYGNPISSLAQGAAKITVHSNVAVQQAGQPPTSGQFPWNGQNYNIVGTLTATLSYNEQPTWVVQVPLGLAEFYPVAQLSGVVWSSVLQPLLTGFINGLRSCFSRAAGISSEVEAASVAEAAAEDAAIEGEIVADAEVSLVAGPAAVIVLVVLLALPFIVGALLHPTYHSLAIYNLTPYDVTWQLCLMEGAVSAEPTVAAGSEQAETLIPAMSSMAPPGVTPVPVAHQASFSVASTSEVKGLGYVMLLTLTDPTNNNSVVGEAAMAFDVPFWGDNSLIASWGSVGSPSDYYSDMEGEHKQISFMAGGPAEGRPVSLTVTYDALSGKQPVGGGQDAYAYNSAAILAMG